MFTLTMFVQTKFHVIKDKQDFEGFYNLLA